MLHLSVALAVGAALGAEYRPDGAAWNGLGSFVGLARDLGCAVEVAERIEWDRFDGNEVLALVYPQPAAAENGGGSGGGNGGGSLDPERLALYLRAGGRALIADDFGDGRAALARLGVTRHEEPLPERDVRGYRGNVRLPIAVAAHLTPLGRSSAHIVTNHPAWFTTNLPGTYRFTSEAAAVVEGTLGRGRFVALSDPSVLINNMQELPENRAFAAGLVGDLCRPGTDRLVLVVGEVRESGRPPWFLSHAPGGISGGPLAERVNAALDAFGDAAGGFGGRLLLGLVAVGLALAVALRAMPGQLPAPETSWTRAPAPPPLGYEALVRRYAAGDLPWGDQLLAGILREELALRLAAALGRDLAGMRTAPSEIERLVSERMGPPAGRRARKLWAQLARLSDQSAVSPRRLARLHDEAQRLFQDLPASTASAAGPAGRQG